MFVPVEFDKYASCDFDESTKMKYMLELERCTAAGDFEAAERIMKVLRHKKKHASKAQTAEQKHKRLCRLEEDLHVRLEEIQRKKQEHLLVLQHLEQREAEIDVNQREGSSEEPLSPISVASPWM
jgi:hypothetical protein